MSLISACDELEGSYSFTKSVVDSRYEKLTVGKKRPKEVRSVIPGM